MAMGNVLSSVVQKSSSITGLLRYDPKPFFTISSTSIRSALCFGHLCNNASKSSPNRYCTDLSSPNSCPYASRVRNGEYTNVEVSRTIEASPSSEPEGVRRIRIPKFSKNDSSFLVNVGSWAYTCIDMSSFCRRMSRIANKMTSCFNLLDCPLATRRLPRPSDKTFVIGPWAFFNIADSCRWMVCASCESS